MEFIKYCFDEHPIASIMIIIFATILIWHCVRTSISKEVNENGEEITKFHLSSDAKRPSYMPCFFHLLWRDAIGVYKNLQMQARTSTSGLANLKIKTRLITTIGTNKHEWSY